MRQSVKSTSIALLFSILAIISCQKSDTTVTPATSGTVSAITCGSVLFSTTAASGTAYTGTATVPYTGGNSVAYTAGSAIASTGVTGLMATLQAGTLASGAGNLTYAITGTPSAAGTATFALSFGGQTCSLALPVGTPASGTVSGNVSSITGALAVTATANTSCATSTGIAKVVCLTEAFKATLTSTQLATTQLAYSKANAQKWSNLPAGLSARIGIKLGSLSTAQLNAFRDLMVAVLALNTADEGYDEMLGNLVADDYLSTIGGGSDYGAGNFYLSILGTPSATGFGRFSSPATTTPSPIPSMRVSLRALRPLSGALSQPQR